MALWRTSRLLIVAGKGGVGKTTVTATLARAAAADGLRVLVVAVDDASPIGPLLGLDGPLVSTEPVDCGENVWAQVVTPARALDDYLDAHGMRLIARTMVRAGVMDIVATAAPGIDDIVVLGKLKALAKAAGEHGPYDVVLVDAPAAGHAVTFLRSARALGDMISVGPIATQAREVAAVLADHELCQVVLVTLPEETPVNELIETAFALEDELGLNLGPIIVNAVVSDVAGLKVPARGSAALREAAAYRLAWCDRQRTQIERLAGALPLPQAVVPFVFSAELTPSDISRLAEDFEVPG